MKIISVTAFLILAGLFLASIADDSHADGTVSCPGTPISDC